MAVALKSCSTLLSLEIRAFHHKAQVWQERFLEPEASVIARRCSAAMEAAQEHSLRAHLAYITFAV